MAKAMSEHRRRKGVSRNQVMAAEAVLMKAAAAFGRDWGCDQREHPRGYWLELHIERWGLLARSALAYAECFDGDPKQNGEMSEATTTKGT